MIMSPKLLYLLMVPAFFLSCEKREKEALQMQVDSLRTELQKSYEMSQTLTEVGVLLDSIDASRQLLRVRLEKGTPYDDYAERLKEVNDYIRTTAGKIENLEHNLNTSSANAKALARTVKVLKNELAKKGEEVAFLQEQVEKFRNENQNLIITVDLQDAEIADKQAQIEAKEQELALIEARVQELMIQSKVSEAEAYFTRAQAIEKAASRTKLAPRKRKETIKEAIDLYKKALSMGKTEAEAKITELEARL
jgi:chromosome segregation ATPase